VGFAAGADIARASGRIVGYQLSDWVVPLPSDMLLGRGHLGDGSIDFRPISQQYLPRASTVSSRLRS